jgi:hypothetical protein
MMRKSRNNSKPPFYIVTRVYYTQLVKQDITLRVYYTQLVNRTLPITPS